MSSQENIEYRLAQLEREIKRMGDVLTTVRDKVISTPLCPSPGSCIRLDVEIRNHDERITAIERWQNKLIGIGIVALTAASIVGPKISSLVFK